MKKLWVILFILNLSYGGFDNPCDFNESIVAEQKCKEAKERNLVKSAIEIGIKKDEPKDEHPITCNIGCSDESVSLNDLFYKVITINIAISCYKNHSSLASFEKCLNDNTSKVKLEEPKILMRKESSVVKGVNTGTILGGR